MVEIYADIVFIINLIMDILIFWIVSKLIKKKIKFLRLLVGGFISALFFCFIIFIPLLRPIYNFPIMLLILALGVTITFMPTSLKELIKLLIFSHISAFCVGGMGIALFYFTNISNLIGNMVGFYVEDFSIKLLLVISCTTYIIIKLSVGWFKRIVVKKQKFYPIKIYLDDDYIDLLALLDTGNSIHDPLSDAPVIVAEFNSIKNFLPNDLKLIFYENKEEDFFKVLNVVDVKFSKRIRMIPYASLGKQNGMLLGFRPDKVEICNSEKSIFINNVIIGIYNFNLTKDNSYQGLLTPEAVCMLEN